MNTPLDAALANGWRRIAPASRAGFFVALCISVLAFGFEMTNLTLHHDDVGQIFLETPELGIHMGRFGAAWMHQYLQGHFFMPFFQMAQAIVMMAIYGVIVARFWGATRALDIALVASILCVFPYMAQTYQYNTSMAINSAAHLLVAAAVILSVRAGVGAIVLGSLLYMVAFSMYQAVVALAPTIFLVWLLMRVLFPGQAPGLWSRATLRSTAGALVAAVAGGGLYLLAVSMLPVELNTYQSTDKAFTAGGGIDLSVALPAIVQGTRSFYFWPEAYLPNLLKKVQLVFLAGSALACFLLPRPWWDKAAALVLLGAACFAPRSLQSLHADGWYHQLALTAYALVIAAAVLLVMRAAPVLIRNGAALLAGLLIAAYVAQCNWISTVNHLNTMAHFTTMTQVLARLRGLPSTDWDGRTIAVVGEYDMGNAYPYKRSTGVASEFLRARHMEKLAKLMRDEARFINANVTMPSIMKFAAARPIWPHPASVGVVNGVGVVVLSKDGAGVGQ